MPPFFGLTNQNKDVFLEHIFILMYYCGFSYHDAYHLPIYQRVWFIERINTEIKRANGQSRAATQNTPDNRAMQGRARNMVPSNQRRFT